MTDWSAAGRKSWETRRKNEKHKKMVEAGKKASITRKRRIAGRKAAITRAHNRDVNKD